MKRSTYDRNIEAFFAKRAAKAFAEDPELITYGLHAPQPAPLLAVRGNNGTVLVVRLDENHTPSCYESADPPGVDPRGWRGATRAYRRAPRQPIGDAPFVSMTRFAEAVGLSKCTLRRLELRGWLKVTKLAGRNYVTAADQAEFMRRMSAVWFAGTVQKPHANHQNVRNRVPLLVWNALSTAVNMSCSCGGNPAGTEACPACMVWHRMSRRFS